MSDFTPPLALPNPPVGEGPTPAPIILTKTDSLFACLCLLSGYLYVRLIIDTRPGAGIAVFALIFMAITIFYLKKQGVTLPKESWVYFSISLLSAASFAVFTNRHLAEYNFLFLTCVSVYWLLCAAGARMENSLGGHIFQDALEGFFIIPFTHFSVAVKSLTQRMKKQQKFLTVLISALIMAPVLYIVVSLLMRADGIFEYIVNSITFSFQKSIADTLLQIFISLPIGCYLFGLLYGSLHQKKKKTLSLPIFDIPAAAIPTMLLLLAGVYLLFFITQTIGIANVLQGGGTGDFSYAEYARRGFFELCQAAAINLFFFVAVRLLSKKEGRTATALLCLLGIETLLLISTAVFKMGLYIEVYGLTLRRVHATWFMFVLFFVFVLLIVSLYQKQINTVKWSVLFGSVAFLALCYCNVGGIIAQYNITRYMAGSLETMDVSQFSPVREEAAPHLIELYEKTTEDELKQSIVLFFKNDLPDGLRQAQRNISPVFDWSGYSLQRISYNRQVTEFFTTHPELSSMP